MRQSPSLAEQIEANLPKLDARPEFRAGRLWLTFYLVGSPGNLQRVSERLKASGWLNVDGWEGACLYPKVQVEKAVDVVVRVAVSTKELCGPHDIEILNIDADTSPNVERSQFVTLYRD